MVSLIYQNKIVFPIVISILLFLFNCTHIKVQQEKESPLQTPVLSEKPQPKTQIKDSWSPENTLPRESSEQNIKPDQRFQTDVNLPRESSKSNSGQDQQHQTKDGLRQESSISKTELEQLPTREKRSTTEATEQDHQLELQPQTDFNLPRESSEQRTEPDQPYQVKDSSRPESSEQNTKTELPSQSEGYLSNESADPKTPTTTLQLKLKNCFQVATDLEKQENYGTASQKHSECCFLGNPDSCNQAGQLKLMIFDHVKGARQFFKMACDDKNGLGCFNLHKLENSLGHNVAAENYLHLACSYGLDKACVNHEEEGENYLQSRQFENAVQSFTQALILQPKNDSLLALRGFAYNQSGQYLKAYQDFSEAISINPKEPHYYSQRALYHISRQNYQLAKEDYTFAIGLQEKAEFFRMRGLMELYLGNFRGSIQDNSDAIRIDPNDFKAYVNKGSAWMYLKNYQKAIEDFDHIILLNPDHVFALSNRGMAYQLMGDLKNAKADFRKAVKIDSHNTLMILNYLETKILTDDLKHIDAYINRAYLTARNKEEKLLTTFTHLLIKALQNKSTGNTEKEFTHLLKKKVLLQTNFDALENYLKKIRPSSTSIDQILNYIQELKNPEINLFYH